jgi:type I restriction enzyme, S subunit
MWKTVELGDIFSVGSSRRVLKSEWTNTGVPFYRGREITALSKDGVVDNDLFITEEHFKALSKKYGVPKAGDIMITAIGTIGNCYIVQETDRFYFKDASVLWLKRKGDTSSKFVEYWLRSSAFRSQ